MRAFIPLSILMLMLAGCVEAEEPITRGGDLPRLAPAVQETANGGSEDGVAHAQAPRPAKQRPTPAPVPPPEVNPGDERAPDRFTVRLDTTKGPILMDVQRAWAPHGADRFYTLVRAGYYTDVAFFRVIEGFMAQGGIHGTPAMNVTWRGRNIPDDPVVQHNSRGWVSYAMAGPGTRTTQFFINLVDNARLDGMGFAPFAQVQASSMAVVDRLHAGYGEGAPRGRGPAQGRLQSEGNAYLRAEFPDLDYIRSASIVP